MILVQKDRVELDMTFLDGTNIRTQQKAAGAPRKRIRQRTGMTGRHWAGLGTASAPKRA
jgi:hypothetical protein